MRTVKMAALARAEQRAIRRKMKRGLILVARFSFDGLIEMHCLEIYI